MNWNRANGHWPQMREQHIVMRFGPPRLTNLVSAPGVSIFGVGAAFWELRGGGLVFALIRSRTAPQTRQAP